MRGHLDMAAIHGPYQVSGKILLLPIGGRGSSDIKFGKFSTVTHVRTL